MHHGNALDLPFPDDNFDVVWMQNVGMNIADKRYADSASVSSNTAMYAPGLPRTFYAGLELKW